MRQICKICNSYMQCVAHPHNPWNINAFLKCYICGNTIPSKGENPFIEKKEEPMESKEVLIWKKGENVKLSKYFNSSEFENKGDTHYLIQKELIDILDAIRVEFGKALRITSGYRSESYNKSIGGAKDSTHIQGGGADISPVDFSKAELDRLYDICCKHAKAVGDGRKRGFIHIDTRTDKVRRWDY